MKAGLTVLLAVASASVNTHVKVETVNFDEDLLNTEKNIAETSAWKEKKDNKKKEGPQTKTKPEEPQVFDENAQRLIEVMFQERDWYFFSDKEKFRNEISLWVTKNSVEDNKKYLEFFDIRKKGIKGESLDRAKQGIKNAMDKLKIYTVTDGMFKPVNEGVGSKTSWDDLQQWVIRKYSKIDDYMRHFDKAIKDYQEEKKRHRIAKKTGMELGYVGRELDNALGNEEDAVENIKKIQKVMKKTGCSYNKAAKQLQKLDVPAIFRAYEAKEAMKIDVTLSMQGQVDEVIGQGYGPTLYGCDGKIDGSTAVRVTAKWGRLSKEAQINGISIEEKEAVKILNVLDKHVEKFPGKTIAKSITVKISRAKLNEIKENAKKETGH